MLGWAGLKKKKGEFLFLFLNLNNNILNISCLLKKKKESEINKLVNSTYLQLQCVYV